MHFLYYLHAAIFFFLIISLFVLIKGNYKRFTALYTSVYVLFSILFIVFSFFCVTQNYDILYISQNRITENSIFLRFASLWAGREGSLFLWTYILSTIILLFSFNSKKNYLSPGYVLPAFIILSVLMLINILYAVPFRQAGSSSGTMNSALNSLWMVIHPPLLFTGYSFGILLFSIITGDSISKSKKNKTDGLFRKYSLLTFLYITAGIATGGLWAYQTLGWGGFWAWDPVENSSLVPWLFTLAFIHFSAGNTIHATAKLSGLLVWWSASAGVFLTRSGLLSDTSVHSFQPGGTAFPYLVLLLINTALVLFVSFRIFRRKEGPSTTAKTAAGQIFFISGVIVFVLTVLPVLLDLVTNSAYSVSQGLYNSVSIFVLIVICILFIFRTHNRKLLTAALLLWIVPCFLLINLSVPVYMIFLFYLLAVSITLIIAAGEKTGVKLIHIGFIVFCAGVLASFGLSEPHRFDITAGGTKNIAGRKVTFQTENSHFTISVDGRSKSLRGESFDKPLIYRFLSHELYLSVLKYMSSSEITGTVRVDLNETIEFENLSVTYADKSNNTYTLIISDTSKEYWAMLSSENSSAYFETSNGNKRIDLKIIGGDEQWLMLWIEPDPSRKMLPPVLVLEAATKPLIYLLYAGILTAITGTALSLWKKNDFR